MNHTIDYLRNQLSHQIIGGNAFQKIEKVLEMVDFDQIGRRFPGVPYSFWQQFEHMRITQKDILDFSTNKDYMELDWPKDYWPEQSAPPSKVHWESDIKKFFGDREAFLDLVLDPDIDLFKPFNHGNGQTIFREALLILEHNAYHTGQLFMIYRLINEDIGK